MATSPTIELLNHLIEINKNAESGFQTAAANIRNTELESLFSGYAKQHANFAVQLQSEIDRLDGTPVDSGTLGGAIHRGWMDVTSALTGHSAGSILSSCLTGEESAEAAYADGVDAIPSGQSHTLIQKHCEQVKGFRTRLARLVGETKDGVDFQKNE
jgi:uncharacterized protein (TIGR02284 family)